MRNLAAFNNAMVLTLNLQWPDYSFIVKVLRVYSL